MNQDTVHQNQININVPVQQIQGNVGNIAVNMIPNMQSPVLTVSSSQAVVGPPGNFYPSYGMNQAQGLCANPVGIPNMPVNAFMANAAATGGLPPFASFGPNISPNVMNANSTQNPTGMAASPVQGSDSSKVPVSVTGNTNALPSFGQYFFSQFPQPHIANPQHLASHGFVQNHGVNQNFILPQMQMVNMNSPQFLSPGHANFSAAFNPSFIMNNFGINPQAVNPINFAAMGNAGFVNPNIQNVQNVIPQTGQLNQMSPVITPQQQSIPTFQVIGQNGALGANNSLSCCGQVTKTTQTITVANSNCMSSPNTAQVHTQIVTTTIMSHNAQAKTTETIQSTNLSPSNSKCSPHSNDSDKEICSAGIKNQHSGNVSASGITCHTQTVTKSGTCLYNTSTKLSKTKCQTVSKLITAQLSGAANKVFTPPATVPTSPYSDLHSIKEHSMVTFKTEEKHPTVGTDCAKTDVGKVNSVIIPFGWKRLVENESVVYYSPSDVRLVSQEAVKQYLSLDGTCKCGLECPLQVEAVFDFNVDTKTRDWNVTDFKHMEPLTNLCNHKRKIVAMATFENSKAVNFAKRNLSENMLYHNSRYPDRTNTRVMKSRKSSKHKPNQSKLKKQSAEEQYLSCEVKSDPGNNIKDGDFVITCKSEDQFTDDLKMTLKKVKESKPKDSMLNCEKVNINTHGNMDSSGRKKSPTKSDMAMTEKLNQMTEHQSLMNMVGNPQIMNCLQNPAFQGIHPLLQEAGLFCDARLMCPPFNNPFLQIPNQLHPHAFASGSLDPSIGPYGIPPFGPEYMFNNMCPPGKDVVWPEAEKTRGKRTKSKRERKKSKKNVGEPCPNVDISKMQKEINRVEQEKAAAAVKRTVSFIDNPAAFLAEQTALMNYSLASSKMFPLATLSPNSESDKAEESNTDLSMDVENLDCTLESSETASSNSPNNDGNLSDQETTSSSISTNSDTSGSKHLPASSPMATANLETEGCEKSEMSKNNMKSVLPASNIEIKPLTPKVKSELEKKQCIKSEPGKVDGISTTLGNCLNAIQQVLGHRNVDEYPASSLLSAAAKAQVSPQNNQVNFLFGFQPGMHGLLQQQDLQSMKSVPVTNPTNLVVSTEGTAVSQQSVLQNNPMCNMNFVGLPNPNVMNVDPLAVHCNVNDINFQFNALMQNLATATANLLTQLKSQPQLAEQFAFNMQQPLSVKTEPFGDGEHKFRPSGDILSDVDILNKLVSIDNSLQKSHFIEGQPFKNFNQHISQIVSDINVMNLQNPVSASMPPISLPMVTHVTNSINQAIPALGNFQPNTLSSLNNQQMYLHLMNSCGFPNINAVGPTNSPLILPTPPVSNVQNVTILNSIPNVNIVQNNVLPIDTTKQQTDENVQDKPSPRPPTSSEEKKTSTSSNINKSGFEKSAHIPSSHSVNNGSKFMVLPNPQLPNSQTFPLFNLPEQNPVEKSDMTVIRDEHQLHNLASLITQQQSALTGLDMMHSLLNTTQNLNGLSAGNMTNLQLQVLQLQQQLLQQIQQLQGMQTYVSQLNQQQSNNVSSTDGDEVSDKMKTSTVQPGNDKSYSANHPTVFVPKITKELSQTQVNNSPISSQISSINQFCSEALKIIPPSNTQLTVSTSKVDLSGCEQSPCVSANQTTKQTCSGKVDSNSSKSKLICDFIKCDKSRKKMENKLREICDKVISSSSVFHKTEPVPIENNSNESSGTDVLVRSTDTHQGVSDDHSLSNIDGHLTKPKSVKDKSLKRQHVYDKEDIDDNSAEENCDKQKPGMKKTFNIGDLIWGQVNDYPFWPGKLIQKDNGTVTPSDGKLLVKWFGNNTISEVDPHKLQTLSEGLKAYSKPDRMNKNKEMKMCPNLEAAIQEATVEMKNRLQR